MDAFDVLGLEPAFDLDANALERRYRELQKQLHPDKFVHASSSERRASLARAVSVNEAYRVLRDELKRAELLLARHAGSALGTATVDPELLLEVMELREDLASAKRHRDLPRARALASDVAAREQAEKDKLRQALSQIDEGSSALQQAGHAITRLRYFRRFHEEAAAIEDELAE